MHFSSPYKNVIPYRMKIYSFPLSVTSRNTKNNFVWYSVCHFKSVDKYVQIMFPPLFVEYDSNPRVTLE